MNHDKMGRRLSWILRHCREPLYIDPDGGWAPVETILKILPASPSELEEVVAQDCKNRFSYDETGTRIRANQGHSIPGVAIRMEQPEVPEFLYHGTAIRFLDSIQAEGLKPMSRLLVHLSKDFETAVQVGSRHGVPAVLRIRAQAFVQAGYELHRSANGVWQAREVPPEFFELIWKKE